MGFGYPRATPQAHDQIVSVGHASIMRNSPAIETTIHRSFGGIDVFAIKAG